MYGIGGNKFARETYRQGLLDNSRLLMGDDRISLQIFHY